MARTALLAVLLASTSALAAPVPSLFSMFANLVTRSPTLPPSSLPSPDPSWNLTYVALGYGTQNYTCASNSATPVAVGALADLYDMTTAMSIPAMSQLAETRSTCNADKYQTTFALPRLGKHYFTSAGVPSFDLSAGSSSPTMPQGYFLSGKKTAAAAAPSDACTGRDGAAAVPWLQLIDNGAGTTRGLKAVYRVETTGGSAPTSCDGMPAAFTRDYAAEYWFYS